MKVRSTTLLFIVLIALLFTGLCVKAQTATVITDKPDYHPGETLIITGSGWQAGETVKLQLEETPAFCLAGHDLYATADTNGEILNNQFIFKESHLGISFLLMATGQTSGYQAEVLFTDANFSSAISGNWNDPATWGRSGVPIEGVNFPGGLDIVSIVSGHQVTLTQNHSSGTLMVSAGTVAHTTSKLTTQTFDLSVNGNLTISADLFNHHAEVSIGTGKLNVSGNIYFGGQKYPTHRKIEFAGAGTLGFGGILSTTGTINLGSGTIEFNGANPQTVPTLPYHNLNIIGTGVKKPHGSITITGDLLVEAGAILTLGKADITINGNKSVIINGRVNMNDGGSLLDGNFKNSLYVNSGGYLNVAGDLMNFPTFDEITSVHPNSTVEYGAAGKQTVGTKFAYGNLILSGGEKIVGTLPEILTVKGSLTVSSGAKLFTSGKVINLEGHFIIRGTIEHGIIGTINLVGAEQTIESPNSHPSLSHLNIAGSGDKTLAGGITIIRSLTLTNNHIHVGSRPFIISGSALIIGGSTSSHIVGKLTHQVTSPGLKFFPIGKGGAYRPVYLNYTALTPQDHVSIEQFETGFSGTLPSGITQLGTRFWRITEASLTARTYELTLDGEGFNPTGQVVFLKYNSPSTATIPTTVASLAQLQKGYKNLTGLTTFGDFALGEINIASTITVNSSTATYGNNSNLSASVSPANATGNVVFYVNNVSVGTAVLASGIATLNYSLGDHNAGSYSLRAEYLGDGIYQSSTSNPSSDVTLTIDKRPLKVSASGIDKIYDGQSSATVTLIDDRISGDDLITNYTAASFGDKNIGPGKPVNVSGIGITGPGAANYTVNTSTSTNAEITPRTLTVRATGVDKIYDRKVEASVSLDDDRIYGDVLNPDYTIANFENKNIGSDKPITVSGIHITGDDAGNYTANADAVTNANITPLALLGSFNAGNKLYDGSKMSTVVSATLEGVLSQDEISLVGGTATFADKGVAEGKTVTLTGATLAGADATNYFLESVNTTTADIFALPITGYFSALSKLYDGKTTAEINNRSLVGYVTSDEVSLVGGTATFDNKSVGINKIVRLIGATLAGIDAGNYTLNDVVATNNDILPMGLLGIFTAEDKIYDGNTLATGNNRSLAGVVQDDDVSLLGGTAAFNNKIVGTAKVVTLADATLSGADAGNYTLTGVAATTANITQKALEISITAENKEYDGNTNATTSAIIASGLVEGDRVTVASTNGLFNDKNVADGKVVTADLSMSGTDEGNYSANTTAGTNADITLKALGIAISATDKQYDGNDIAVTAASITEGLVEGDQVTVASTNGRFNDKNVANGKAVTADVSKSGSDEGNYSANTTAHTTADITKKTLVIAIRATDKEYDGNAIAATAASVAVGLVEGDQVTVASTNGLFNDKNVADGKAVAADVSKSGTDEGNYSANTTATTTANIIARPITITADSKSKIYGNADPLPFTYKVSSGSLVTGENFTGTLSRITGENVGKYAIQKGSLALTNNYELSYVQADLAITPRPVTIAATAQSKYCSQLDPPLSYSIVSGNLVNGDTFSGSLTRDAGESSGQTYMINQGDVALSTNYELIYNSAMLRINSATVDANLNSTPQPVSSQVILKATVSPQVAGALVSFYVDDEFIANALTNTSGLASITVALASNVYEVKAIVGEGCSESVVFLPVYDPNGGFVTGGGWILSPPNAYVANPDAEGKANFGFVAKYKKGSTVPEGNTEFQFKAGNMNFNSSAYDDMRLVIAGSKANYKGTGKINGAGDYGFMVSAVDGQVNGGGGADRYRIKIWDKSTGSVVYDNNLGADENDLPSTSLGGGSIVIHEVKGGKQLSTTPLVEATNGLDMKIVEPILAQSIKLGAYPNPFGKQSTIAFTLPTDEQMVTLDLYDLKGSKVKRMYEGKAGANQTLEFEFNGTSLSPGMYLLRLTTPKKVENFKMIMTE